MAQVVDRSSMTGKALCGYQGWFTCPGDGSDPVMGWWHWGEDRSWLGAGNYIFDMWPDVAEYAASDLFTVPGVSLRYGGTPRLFSNYRAGVVNAHFRWMQENQIDGAFLQRFTTDESFPEGWAVRNTVVGHVKNAAATYGRTWAIEYDVFGDTQTDTLLTRLQDDWTYLGNTFNIYSDPRYLYHNGKPVVMFFMFGQSGTPWQTPALVQSIIDWFKGEGCFVVACIPNYWRTLINDSQSDPAWATVFRSLNAITSWTVNYYWDWNWVGDRPGIEWVRDNLWIPDRQECDACGMLYMTTIWPRFARDNIMNAPCGSTRVSPRGGQHLWDQFYASKQAGTAANFIAMYDEYNEGTAIMKMSDNYPTTDCWIDNEGKASDWFLRLSNYGGKMLRGEIGLSRTIPISSSSSPDNATMISNTIPSTMTAGQQYNVSVTVQNTGETIWNDDIFKLGGVGDSDPFADARQWMTPGTRVMPNGQYTFNFIMTAPTTPGTYTSDWQMLHDYVRWFGDTLVKEIEVTGAAPDSAEYISDTIPTTMNPGQQYNVSVTMKNTGTATWSEAQYYRLGAVDDSDPFYGPGNRVIITGGQTVPPQQNYTFNFTMTAPTTPALYTTDWRMVHDLVAWFGDTLVKQVQVGASQTPYAGVIQLPGTVQAENYDNGGEGVAYHDTTSGNAGGEYRSNDVDIQTTTDSGGGYNAGWTAAGEWLEYTVNAPQTGDYNLKMRVASNTAVGQYHVEIDGSDITGVRSFPATGGNQTWTTVTVPSRPMAPGQHILRVYLNGGGWNFNKLDVAYLGGDAIGIDMATTNIEDALSLVTVSDGDTTGQTKNGHYCRKNVNSANDYYFYFNVYDGYAYQGSKPDVYITLDYFDTGGGSISLQYDSISGGAYKSGTSVTVGSTNTWKTYTWHITDAYFGNRQNNGADFRFFLGTNKTRWLDTASVSPGSP